MANYNVSSKTIDLIAAELGFPVVLVSAAEFEADGEWRTRYTVRRPAGKKLIHLIGYPHPAACVKVCA